MKDNSVRTAPVLAPLNRRGAVNPAVIGIIALVVVGLLVYFLVMGGGGGGGASHALANKVIPSNVQAYGAIDGKGLRNSSLYKSFETEINAAMAAGPVKEMMDKTGLKPDSFDTMVFGVDSVSAMEGPPNAVIALKGSFDGAKLISAFKEEAGEGATEKDLEGKKFIGGPMGDFGAVDLGEGTLLLGNESMVGQSLKVHGGGDSVKKNAELQSVASKVDSGATFWMVGAMPGEIKGAVGAIPMLPGGLSEIGNATHFGVSYDLSSGLAVKTALVLGSDDGAKAFADGVPSAVSLAKGGLGMMMAGGGDPKMAELKPIIEGVLESVKAEASGKVAVVEISIGQDSLDKIIKFAKDQGIEGLM